MDIIIVLSLILLVTLVLSGAPFYVAFVAFSIIFLSFYADFPPKVLGAEASEAVTSFTLLAIPLFILLGSIMSRIGAAADLFNLARSFVGHIPGGMAITTVVSAAGFGAMSGSGLATAMAVSGIAVPELERYGYRRSTVAAICACAGGLGLIIPPSLGFIILGEVLEVSVGDLFMGGVVPGILAAGLLSVVCYISGVRNPAIIRGERVCWREKGFSVLRALPALLIPASILVSIYYGVATPTETAAVACFIAGLLGIFYYRSLSFDVIRSALKDTARSTGAVWLVIVGALMIGRALAVEGVPQSTATILNGLDLNYTGFILTLLCLVFILGMFFDAFILALAALPPLVISLNTYDVPLVWFGVVFQLMIVIGQVTPPVGITLYAAAAGANARTSDTIKQALPYLGALVAAVVLLVAIPDLVMF